MGIMDDLGVSLPSYNAGGMGTSLMYIFIFLIFMGCLGLGVWWYIDNKKYKYRIEIFENLGGTRYVKTGVDRAKVMRLGDGGEELLWLKKKKRFENAYGRKMGHNLLWYAIGQDGYWYNCTLGDLDAKQGMLDIEPIDRDMRYMHVAIRKNITERYKKTNFMEKYGVMLMGGLFLIIMIGGIWFLLDKMAESSSTMAEVSRVSLKVLQGNEQVLTALDNVISGSGIKSVTPVP